MITIDYQDKRPLYEQVYEKMQKIIVKGVLKADDKLPSVRSLAIELSINPNTIQRAYTELEQDGFIYTVKGRGNFVAYRDKWIDDKKADVILELKNSIKKAYALDVSRSEIEHMLEAIYEGGEK